MLDVCPKIKKICINCGTSYGELHCAVAHLIRNKMGWNKSTKVKDLPCCPHGLDKKIKQERTSW
jgi:hypothetical protein